MDSELVFGSFGQMDERQGLFGRPSKSQRALQERAELDVAKLLVSARKQDVTGALRKRITENGLRDARDVLELLKELSGGDEMMARALLPIYSEFARQTARDVRDFGREFGL
ncbi:MULTISPECIES: hypothetical protein [unclassified Streptomyces]|uniref:Uncharacterized protein n=1 Tax=Streptomyces sp. NBC_00060 TaxID=2975636 RepID=A0AAU2GUM2_9ACTN